METYPSGRQSERTQGGRWQLGPGWLSGMGGREETRAGFSGPTTCLLSASGVEGTRRAVQVLSNGEQDRPARR